MSSRLGGSGLVAEGGPWGANCEQSPRTGFALLHPRVAGGVGRGARYLTLSPWSAVICRCQKT
jgi:hypothetical protein